MMKAFIIILFILQSAFGAIGTLMTYKGKVAVIRDTQTIGAQMGMDILQKDKVITEKESRVQIMLKDKTVVTIGENSEFDFESFKFDGKNSEVKMRSRRGFFRSVTGEIGKLAPERFKVTTKSATIGIRGTDFEGYTGGEKERFICNRGVIFVSIRTGEQFTLQAGEFIMIGRMGIIKKGKVFLRETTSSQNKTDKESSRQNGEKEDTTATEGKKEREVFEIEKRITKESHTITPEDIADITQTADTSNNDAALQPDISSQPRPVEY